MLSWNVLLSTDTQGELLGLNSVSADECRVSAYRKMEVEWSRQKQEDMR